MKFVVVASTNPCKVDACRLAFSRIFKSEEFEYVQMSSKSGVSDQPMSSDETRNGAKNRVMDALSKWRNDHIEDPEYVVGLEGGIQMDAIPGDPPNTGESMRLVAWMAIYSPSRDKWGYGQTGSFFLPPPIVELVNQGMELGMADDQFFGTEMSGQGSGTVGILTNNVITRSIYYEHALILALIPFIRPDIY